MEDILYIRKIDGTKMMISLSDVALTIGLEKSDHGCEKLFPIQALVHLLELESS